MGWEEGEGRGVRVGGTPKGEGWDPEGWDPEGWDREGWDPEGWGGAQNFVFFFPSPATIFILSPLLGCPFVDFWWSLKRQGLKCARLGSQAVV